MIKTKKLAFSAVTVRQLTSNMSEEELRAVAGGTVILATGRCAVAGNGATTLGGIPTGGGITGGGGGLNTNRCPSVGSPTGMTDPNQC